MRVEAPRRPAGEDERPGRARGTATSAPRPQLGDALRLAGMRLTHGWRLLLGIGFGILVAVVLLSAVPLYATLTGDLQLQVALHAAGPPGRNVEAELQSQTVDDLTHARADAAVRRVGQRALAGVANSTPTYYVNSDSLQLLQAGAYVYAPGANSPRTINASAVCEGFDFQSAGPHIHLLAGRLPVAAAGSAQIEALVTQEFADDYHLTIGDTLAWREAHPEAAQPPQVSARVVGIWVPRAVDDPYWNGLTFGAGFAGKVYPVLITIPDFFSRLSALPTVGMRQHWIYYTRSDALTAADLARPAQALTDFKRDVDNVLTGQANVQDVAVRSDLDRILRDVRAQLSLLALPLYMIAAQVVGLALLFVAALAALMIESQGLEIATLTSRGASRAQLLIAFVCQAALVALAAAVVAPFVAPPLALALLRAFVPPATFAATDVTPAYYAGAADPHAALLPALLGALLGVGAVAAAALQSARLDVRAYHIARGRTLREPLWKRLYLDVALALLCAAGYAELAQFGGIGARAQLVGTGQTASPFQLLAPALLLLSGALLLLRLLPLAARLAERAALRGRGLAGVLALAEVERQPGRYARLTLLLALAVGLGVFALSFDATLRGDAHDRATYAVGAPVRVIEDRAPGATAFSSQEEQQFAQLPGVAELMPAYRSFAATPREQGNQLVSVLAIDPARFGAVSGGVAWRADYAGQSLDGLLAGMRAHHQGPQAGAQSAPLWALVSQTFADQRHLHAGDRFTLTPNEDEFAAFGFVVGAVVRDFPTLYPAQIPGGFVVVDYDDYLNALQGTNPFGRPGANEYWIQTRDAAATQRLLAVLANQRSSLQILQVLDLPDALIGTGGNPIAAGMRGLLLVGALTALLLAVVACLAEAALAARRRAPQFAVLRTLGMANGQIGRLLLVEQLATELAGLVGGALLGALALSATLPFLVVSETFGVAGTSDAATLGVPPAVLAVDGWRLALLGAALLLACAVGLGLTVLAARRLRLGQALRLGDD